MLCPLFCYYLQFHYNLRIFLHVFYIIFTWIYFLLLLFFLRFGYSVATGYLLYSLFIWVPFFSLDLVVLFFSIQTLRFSIYHPHYFSFKYTSVPLFSVHTEAHSCLQIVLYSMFPSLLPIELIFLFSLSHLPRLISLRFPLLLSLLLSYRVTCCYIVVIDKLCSNTATIWYGKQTDFPAHRTYTHTHKMTSIKLNRSGYVSIKR